MAERTYIAIDLKSFYASVECAERHLDPMSTNLVVADASRTEKTICLAVSPSLKAIGIPGRPRLFEVVQKVKEVNAKRLSEAIRQHRAACSGDRWAFSSASFDASALAADPSLELSYIIAPPRMATYMAYSTRIYQIYLQYVDASDIHVYSIDEVFIDVTCYLKLHGMSVRDLAKAMIRDVLYSTGITATAGIGTNLYLAKVAMDIVAKHVPADKDGVRIAELNEQSYRRQLWTHEPLTDFWRVGRGYARRLEAAGMYTLGDVARCSLVDEDKLYKMFGINAQLLIDHAWGWEPVTIADIKAYKPESNSISSGQVLSCPYSFEKAKLVVREMTDLLVLDLVDKGLVTDQVVLTVGYDTESLTNPEIRTKYHGPVTTDMYGREIPKSAHGTISLGKKTSSTRQIVTAAMELYDRIVNKDLLVRRMYVVAGRVVREDTLSEDDACEQLDMFTDYEKLEQERKEERAALERERHLQQAAIGIKKKYGKNALLKGMNLEEGATARDRNRQIGGHKA